MEKTAINPKLRAAIKLRHLVEAISTDWGQLATVGKGVRKQLQQAEELAQVHGDAVFHAEFQRLLAGIRAEISGVESMLTKAAATLEQGKPIDPAMDWAGMQGHLHAAEDLFRRMKQLPFAGTASTNARDWNALWEVVRANMDAVRGLCSAAYLKARMIAELGKDPFMKKVMDSQKEWVKKVVFYNMTNATDYKGAFNHHFPGVLKT